MYILCIYEKNIVLSLIKIDTLNFTMYILTILTWPLKTYIIRLHNLISMNTFFTEGLVFLYNCKETSKTNKLLKRIIRSSRSLFFKIGVLRNFLTCKGKHQFWSLFSINLEACNFMKKKLQHRCFSVNITKFLRTPPVAASE